MLTYGEAPRHPPKADSVFARPKISSTGNDDVLLILGVNSLVRESDPEIVVLSWFPEKEVSGAGSVIAFSISGEDVLYLKFNFGKILLLDDFGLVVEDPDELFSIGASTERDVTRKLTLLWVGVGLGVNGIFIPTKSLDEDEEEEELDSSDVFKGISNRRLCSLQMMNKNKFHQLVLEIHDT